MTKETFFKFSSLLSLLALSSFIYGFFAEQRAFAVGGGVVLILLDVVAIWVGVLKPLFPLLFASVLALLVKPWYYGVFWSCAVFQILNIPAYIAMLIKPARQSKNDEREQVSNDLAHPITIVPKQSNSGTKSKDFKPEIPGHMQAQE